MKNLIKSLCPPLILKLAKHYLKQDIRWVGDYPTFQEAQAQCSGYDPDIYLNQLIKAVQITQNDPTKCERDSIILDQVTYPYPLLNSLFALAMKFRSQNLSIIDFGGSLGSLYFQNKKFLSLLPHFTWHILEQEKIIQAGKRLFENQQLFFHQDIQELQNKLPPKSTKFLILSSVLQYLEMPYQTLGSLIKSFDFDVILIDRTPFSTNNTHQITIQKVPLTIYSAQYPCHLFSKQELLASLTSAGYQLLDEFYSYCDTSTNQIDFLGFSLYKEKTCSKD